MQDSFSEFLMDQPTLRRMTSCLGFARRQAKKNHMVEVIYPIDVALSFLVGEKWRMCDLPGPRPGIGRKVLPLDELIPHRCNVPDRGTSNVAIQTGDGLKLCDSLQQVAPTDAGGLLAVPALPALVNIFPHLLPAPARDQQRVSEFPRQSTMRNM
mmetsp:Transcript_14303/g.16714  ORF Transcript_14303/g.16714 Transcript_14303/m.16714 type:complete len:155 (-) Transcript_14303:99-563(-)